MPCHRSTLAFALTFILAITGVLACGGSTPADQPRPDATTPDPTEVRPASSAEAEPGAEAGSAPPATGLKRGRFIPPLKGAAEVAYTRPQTKRAGKEIVTTFQIQNLSDAPIAGLQIDEYWWDKSNEVVGGDRFRHRALLQPGEIATVELRSEWNTRMDRSNYNFKHAHGNVKPKQVPKLEPRPEEETQE
jgi:hypothetical protein